MPVPNRPFAVTCLIGLVLTLTGLQALRLWALLVSWKTLNSLSIGISPILLGLMAIIWLAVGLILTWGLWQAKAWAASTILWAAIAFVAVHWFDRLFFASARTTKQQLGFRFSIKHSITRIRN